MQKYKGDDFRPAARDTAEQVVLIVESSPAVRRAQAALLEGLLPGGVCEAGSIAEAEQMILTGATVAPLPVEPVLFVLAAQLPDGDGLALCRWLRADARMRDAAVLVLGASDDPAMLEAAFAAGASDGLVWPGQAALLRIRATAALGQARSVRELRRSEQRLRDITAQLSEGLLVIDTEARLHFMNAEAEQMLGWHAAELLGSDIGVLFRSNAGDTPLAPEQCPLRQSARLGVHYRSDESLFWHREGHPVTVAYRVNPLYEGEQLVGAVTVFHDISTQRRHETERSLAAKALEFSPEGIVVAANDPAHTILKVNPAFSAITGFSTEEMRGRSCHGLFHWREEPDFYARMLGELYARGEWQGEIWSHRKDGSTYPAWLRIAAIRDAHGRPSQYMAIFSDITARKQAEQRLEYLASHDALTGLANRAAFIEQLRRAIKHACCGDQRVAVLFIDLDRFKPVNDQYGHAAGDRLLYEVARRLQSCVRSSDCVARLGGDEFIIAMTGLAGFVGVQRVADQILEILKRPFLLLGHEILISASIGIALFPDDAGDLNGLVECADQALYRAKQSGRNDYQFYQGLRDPD